MAEEKVRLRTADLATETTDPPMSVTQAESTAEPGLLTRAFTFLRRHATAI